MPWYSLPHHHLANPCATCLIMIFSNQNFLSPMKRGAGALTPASPGWWAATTGSAQDSAQRPVRRILSPAVEWTLTAAWTQLSAFQTHVRLSKGTGCSTMTEHPTHDQDVMGSNPTLFILSHFSEPISCISTSDLIAIKIWIQRCAW